MIRKILPLTGVVFLMTGALRLPAAPPEKKQLFSKSADNVVYYVPQFTDFSEISRQEMRFLKKTLREAEKHQVKAVIFELDTPGGSVQTAYQYASVLSRSKVPVIAYVNPHGISGGMIIALAADRIAINPAGIIGDAMPIQLTSGGIVPIIDREKKYERENAPGNSEDKPPAKEGEKKEKPAPKTRDKKTDKDNAVIDQLRQEVKRLKDKFKTKKYKSTEKDLANQKFLTVFFKELEAYAEKNDRPVRVVRAMADPYQKLTLERDGIEHSKISPLTLSAKEAKKLHVVDYVCASRDDLLRQAGLENCRLQVIEKSTLDQLVSFLTHPAIAGVLIALGLIGIYIEIKTPGFGVPGILGITALTLFFLGHMGSGASEWGPIVIFFVGLVLLALEIFVIPGFGLVGLLGISCIVISFFAAFGFENFALASRTIAFSLLGALAVIIYLTVYVLPKSPLFKWVRLDTTQPSGEGYTAHKSVSAELLHQTGEAYTTLRPVGTALINGERYEVTTRGDYIEKGEKIEVIEATPMKIMVKRVF
ncbi:MAG: NfeD family protein [Victivallales bacterium]|nr:NfeD family protein [Victivallales bacterium]